MTSSKAVFRLCVSALVFLFFTAVAFAAPCALNPTNPSVTICTPAPNATVTSPVNIVAAANDSAGSIAMAVYVDNVLISKVNGGQISATASLKAGSHYVVAQVWDNAGRVIKQSENITVSTAQPPPTISFSANPTSISTGQSSTLSWSTSNASSVTISNGVGSQPVNGSVSVSPTATTTYTLTATGPGGTSTAAATVTVSSSTQPPTISFTANPGSISAGASSTLTWSTSNATSVSIDNGIGNQPTSGSLTVTPAATTTYTLTATGPGGTAHAQASVTVTNSGGCAPAKPAPSVTICSPANGSTVPSPVHVLATPASNTGVIAMAVYFDNVLKYKANVNKVDTYVDAAQGGHYVVVQYWDNNGAVPAKASANITVGTASTAPTVSFSASPTSITSGQSSTLTWSSTNATTVSIDNGIGTVSASGAVTVTPTTTTTYTITATGSGGSVTAQATVTVSGSTPAPTATITANPTTISAGQSSTLTWSTTNATSVSIDNGIGTKPTSGSVTVTPSATTTYTLTATGAGGTTTAKATVTVSSTGGTCTAAKPAPSVTICAPANGATVPNPVHVLATPASNNGVIAMAVYFDNNLVYKANVSKVDTLVNTTLGNHYVVVQFWDNSGNVPAKASANITVSNTPPPPAGLTVSPASATVHTDATQQFTATDSNGNVSVTWFVDGVQGGNSTVGTIDANGIYTAPGAAGSHTIKAVSTADSTQSSTAVVNVVDSTVAWTTYHFDQHRTGANTQETILKPSNLNRFGKLATYNVDGQVYAQPLYVPNLTINGNTHNVLYVATEHDSVYAFDADGQSGTPLWQKSLLGPGQTPVQSGDTLGIKPEVGITSTPVIDRNKNLIYVVTYVATSSGNQFWIHALDLVSGSEQLGGPKQVTATVPGTGADSVNGQITLSGGCWQRSGLALGNGQVYVAFAHCNHGWLLAYDQNTLNKTAAYNTTPDGKGGTIWMGGGAPAFDDIGNVFIMTGTNFGSDASNGYNDAFMKFSPSLGLDDYFIPSNNATLVANDVDLGAGAPLILPDNGSSHKYEVVGAGKDGRIFLLDRLNMGKFDANGDHVIQSIQSGATQWNNFHDTPAYWNGNLYYHGNADVLRQFKWTNGLLSTGPAATGGVVFNAHGATPTVSSNGNSDAIVWELQNDSQPSGPAILRAYDATNVATQLYNSAANANDTAPNAVKFTTPTVVNGKVYVGGGNQVAIYGLVR